MKNKTPPDSGSCCLPGAQGVTYLKIGPRQASVGMLNLGIAFQQLYQSGRQLPEISNQDLLESVREFNYISRRSNIEDAYAEALREAYAVYCSKQEE
ncbi:MAG: hypothetical protein U5K99_01870 [Anaerolineales bacterium]|nr:hypothetical protein [Anaerolineales bacterium]